MHRAESWRDATADPNSDSLSLQPFRFALKGKHRSAAMAIVKTAEISAGHAGRIDAQQVATNRRIGSDRGMDPFGDQYPELARIDSATGQLAQAKRRHAPGRQHHRQTAFSHDHRSRPLVERREPAVPRL